MALTKVKGSGLATGAATESLVGIDDNATSTAITIDANENVGVGVAIPLGKLDVVTGVGRITVGESVGEPYLAGTNAAGTARTPIHVRGSEVKLFTENLERMRIDSAGRVTMPNQPAFNVYSPPVTQNAIIIWGTIRTSVGNHYNNTTGLFTAPVSGVYHFTASVLTRYTTGSYHRLLFSINGNATTSYGDTLEDMAGPGYSSPSLSGTFYLGAGDTIGCKIEGAETYGTSYGAFSGHLIG